MWESRGRYTIHFCKTNNREVGIGEDKVFWHDSMCSPKSKSLSLNIEEILSIRLCDHPSIPYK
jgi:hypothetical protein